MRLSIIAVSFLTFPLAAISQPTRLKMNQTRPTAPFPQPIQKRFTLAAPSTTAAVLYVTTPQGVNVYSADSTGKIAQIAGPLTLNGNIIGATKTDLVTIDAENVYDYSVKDDGTLATVSISQDTASYFGSQCGAPSNAILDQRGFIYVQLSGATDDSGDNLCNAIQSFKLDPDSGLTFQGATVYDDNRFATGATLPALGAKFAFNTSAIGESCEQEFNTFSRETTGTLDFISGSFVEPVPDPTGGAFFPLLTAADSAGHLAAAMIQDFAPPCGPVGDIQLASFTIGDDGTLSSTNTYQNMPDVGTDVEDLKIDPTNALLAVAGNGLTLYNFNGSSPITALSQNLLPGAGISKIGFDNFSHLYAWGVDTDDQFKVFTFNVSAQGAGIAGEPLVVPGSTSMVVSIR